MELDDVIGLALCVLAGVAICAAGYLNVGDAWSRAVNSRNWARATARITRAWKVNLGGGPGTRDTTSTTRSPLPRPAAAITATARVALQT